VTLLCFLEAKIIETSFKSPNNYFLFVGGKYEQYFMQKSRVALIQVKMWSAYLKKNLRRDLDNKIERLGP
jgi:hypothetical protein